jgi:O-antigen ligase
MATNSEDLLTEQPFRESPFAQLRESAEAFRLESPLAAASTLFFWCGRLALVGVLVCSPWAFGGAEYEDQRWIYSGVLAALGLWLIGFTVQPRNLRIAQPFVPTLLVPIVAALLLGGLQIIPGFRSKLPKINFASRDVSDSRHATPSGGSTAQTRYDLRDDLTGRPRLSLYPASTRLELSRLSAGAAAFLAGLGLFAAPRMQRLLWLTLGLNGAALALFGISQKLSWNGKIYWRVPLTLGGQPFASFVNRNNAAGYLNLCLAAALAYAIWAFWRPKAVRRPGLARMGLSGDVPLGFRLPQPQHFLAILLSIMILAGVCASLSRGGTIAAAIAGLAVLALLAIQRGARTAAWAGCVGLVLCTTLLGWLGLSGSFANRLATLFDERVAADARWMNWQTALRAVRDFPLLGTGLGTYRYAYQPYQTHSTSLWFFNADNHYVEGLTEGGLVGIVLMGACLGLMIRALWVLLRRGAAGTNDPLVYVALFALVSQFIQAGSDYGISVPANMLTFATMCGVIVGESVRRCVPQRPPFSIALPVWQPRLVMAVLSLALLVNGVLGVEEVCAASAAKAARISVPVLLKPDSLSESKMESAIATLSAAVKRRPDDAELRQALGELWIYRYRQQAFRFWEQRVAENPELESPNWKAIDLTALHRLANRAWHETDRTTLDELRHARIVSENLVPARGHLQAARAACPLLPGIGLNLAMSDFLDDVDPPGMSNLERAVALAPVNEDVLYMAGVLARQASRHDLSEQFWSRCLSLGARHQTAILKVIGENQTSAKTAESLTKPFDANSGTK